MPLQADGQNDYRYGPKTISLAAGTSPGSPKNVCKLSISADFPIHHSPTCEIQTTTHSPRNQCGVHLPPGK